MSGWGQDGEVVQSWLNSIVFVGSKMINKPIIQQSATWLGVSHCNSPIGLCGIEDADWHYQKCAMASCLQLLVGVHRPKIQMWKQSGLKLGTCMIENAFWLWQQDNASGISKYEDKQKKKKKSPSPVFFGVFTFNKVVYLKRLLNVRFS